MATITITQAVFLNNVHDKMVRTRGGAEHPDIKETASQTYAQGAPVYYDSNGTIAVATASSNILNPFAGFAHKAASGTTGEQVTYRPVRGGDRYVMNLKGTSTTTTALGQVGDKAHLDLHTGNLMVVNPDASFDATKPFVIIEGLYTVVNGYKDGDVAGDTNGRLVVRFPDQQGLQG